MVRRISRREVLGNMLCAGAAALLPTCTSAQTTATSVAGQTIQVEVTPITSATIRLTILPLDGDAGKLIHDDGSLLPQKAASVSRLKDLQHPQTLRFEKLSVRLEPDPLSIAVETKTGRLVQRLLIDPQSGAVSFNIHEGPVLGLGEGGPQFDRRGNVDQMRSGQGFYHMPTPDVRAPSPQVDDTGSREGYLRDTPAIVQLLRSG